MVAAVAGATKPIMSHAYNRNKRNVTREDEKGEFVLP
jgi:hypothetical protein